MRNWIAGISHDIRTPLSVITGYAEALSCGKVLSEAQQRKDAVILSNSIKIKKLIDDLNVISDNGTGVPDSVFKNIDKIPKTTHEIGLPMAYRIVSVHNGKFEAYNDNGFCIMMTFPME